MDKSPQPLTEDILKRFLPLANLQPLQLELLCESNQLLWAPAKTSLFTAGDKDANEIFLVEGKLTLTARDGKQHIIEGGSGNTRHPLAHLRPRQYSASALTPIRYFTLDIDVLKDLVTHWSVAANSIHEHNELHVSHDAAAILASFEEDLAVGKFALPTMPDVALRLRERLGNENIDINTAAKLIGTELSVASRIVQAANSPLYRRDQACNTIHSAIMRLGLKTTRHLVLSLALRDVFNNRNVVLKKHFQLCWRQSIAVACTSCVLARHLGGFSTEEALLAGLVHNIGVVAILAYAQNYPALMNHEQQLLKTITSLRDIAGSTLLKHWVFPDSLVQVASAANQPMRTHEGAADLCDLVILARRLARVDELDSHDLNASKTPLPASTKFSKWQNEPAFNTQIETESHALLAEIGSLLY